MSTKKAGPSRVRRSICRSFVLPSNSDLSPGLVVLAAYAYHVYPYRELIRLYGEALLSSSIVYKLLAHHYSTCYIKDSCIINPFLEELHVYEELLVRWYREYTQLRLWIQ